MNTIEIEKETEKTFVTESVWTSTEKGWTCKLKELQAIHGHMPRGESHMDAKVSYRSRWTVKRNKDFEITHWEYRYPDGKIAVIVND